MRALLVRVPAVADIVWLAVAGAVAVGPSLAAGVAGVEVWPWTCAPMFAADVSGAGARVRDSLTRPPVDHGAPDGRAVLYRPRVVVERAGGVEQPFRSRSLNISEPLFARLLFGAYGSVDASSPHSLARGAGGDDPARFRARLRDFFGGVVVHARRAHAKARLPDDTVALRLEIVRVRDGAVHVVGRFTLADADFTLAERPR